LFCEKGEKVQSSQRTWRCFECSESFNDYNVFKLHAREHCFSSATCQFCRQQLYTLENPDRHLCPAKTNGNPSHLQATVRIRPDFGPFVVKR